MYTNQSRWCCKITWFTRLKKYGFFIIFWGSFSQVYASNFSHLVLTPQEFNCEIKIKKIDAIQASAKQQLSSIASSKNWTPVSLPDYWEKRWRHYSGVVWYRIIWSKYCSDSHNEPLALNIESINMAGEVYLNQNLIWRDQNLVEPLSRSWNMPRYWPLSSSDILEGENTFFIKVIGVSTQNPGLGKTYIGNLSSIIKKNNEYLFEHRTLYFINLIMSLTLGFIVFFIWLMRKKESAYGWYALTSLFWGLFIINILNTETYPFTDSLQIAKANIIFLIGYVLSFNLFIWRFAGKKNNLFEGIILSISILGILGLIIIPIQYLGLILLFLFLFCLILFIISCLAYQWFIYKSERMDTRILALVLLCFILISCNDSYLFFTKNMDQPYITPFAAPLMTLAISVIIAWRIAHDVNKIQEFNKTLAQTVEQVTTDLNQSLAKKHLLELENIRLQERLNLAHDLHDGLGGSLVRSMILVDKSHHIDKSHFLSILKLLRSDLRQVIDSGSSIGAEVPNTPTLWAASIRRRFVELFEEIELQSTWNIPQFWQTTPTSLQCITLSRILEEMLTNVLKHSQANNVEISLTQDDAQLCLIIEDNGIGFDPQQVQQGLHVGLHSMQIRVQRLGGNLNILSRHGQTRILVTLPKTS
ncbi:ATP-binding protein [Acinetobacter sp. MD2]|uniref:ATP-binding protein n=1 Tax=Acinetobacter sp. MD2 TaxID=2600066 RepID=UPI002D1E5967|nr:ATP-binding protein [Acinetobacter sp. MD2]MEB3767318.1 histidine kinase [Acinetobacter sp. MD2]